MEKDTGDIQDIEFSEEQQKFVDKLVGRARIEGRESAELTYEEEQEVIEQERMAEKEEWKKLAEHHLSRVKELEPFESQVEEYREAVTDILAERIGSLGKAAEKAIDALPGSLSTLDKLAWLNANEGLFVDDIEDQETVGTPKKATMPPDNGGIEKISKYPIRL